MIRSRLVRKALALALLAGGASASAFAAQGEPAQIAEEGAGALVRGEPLTSLPASVLAVLEADRNGGSFRPIQTALSGDWEISTEQAVTGSRTLTLPIED